MSLGDYLRQLRATHGGETPQEIEAATGLTPGVYRQMEQRYRAVGDDESIARLAEYFGVPFDDLRWRLDWPRKALSHALLRAEQQAAPISFDLCDGQTVEGKVRWWDLGAIGVETESGTTVVVQRHAVNRWDPRFEIESLTETGGPGAE